MSQSGQSVEASVEKRLSLAPSLTADRVALADAGRPRDLGVVRGVSSLRSRSGTRLAWRVSSCQVERVEGISIQLAATIEHRALVSGSAGRNVRSLRQPGRCGVWMRRGVACFGNFSDRVDPRSTLRHRLLSAEATVAKRGRGKALGPEGSLGSLRESQHPHRCRIVRSLSLAFSGPAREAYRVKTTHERGTEALREQARLIRATRSNAKTATPRVFPICSPSFASSTCKH